jgi:hypothetical protein
VAGAILGCYASIKRKSILRTILIGGSIALVMIFLSSVVSEVVLSKLEGKPIATKLIIAGFFRVLFAFPITFQLVSLSIFVCVFVRMSAHFVFDSPKERGSIPQQQSKPASFDLVTLFLFTSVVALVIVHIVLIVKGSLRLI